MDLLEADLYWLNSDPPWSGHIHQNKVLAWLIFTIGQYHTIAVLVFLLVSLMMQASAVHSVEDRVHKVAISTWAWGVQFFVLVAIAASCIVWLLSIAVFSDFAYRVDPLAIQLLLAQWIWNWLGYLLLGVGKGVLLRSYLQRQSVTRHSRVGEEEGTGAPDERSGLLVNSGSSLQIP